MNDTLETHRDGEGNTTNTSPSGKKQCNQLLHWFFTFNNYEDRDLEIMASFFDDRCNRYCFQEEIGENGTKHLQGIISLKSRARWSEFGLSKKIHWEKPKDLAGAYDYCSKDATMAGRRFTKGFTPKKKLKLITPNKWWQIDLINILAQEPDERKVYWYWSEKGGVGKSSFCKFLVAMKNAVFIDEGKKADIMHRIMEADMDTQNIVILDVPRGNGNNISYKSIESIKNGLIFSPKYESKQKLFNSPHVVVFANCEPEYSQFSEDRWVVVNIDI